MARRKKKNDGARSLAPPPPPKPAPPPPAAFAIILAVIAMTAFIALTVAGIVSTSPVFDETTHLAAGYTYVKFGDFRLNPEHPPLLKMLAALPSMTLPVWPLSFEEPGDGAKTLPLLREAWTMGVTTIASQWRFSQLFFYGLRDRVLERTGSTSLSAPSTTAYERADFLNDTERMFYRGRLVILLFGVATGALIFLWSWELWGPWGAALSTLLFAFDPNFIAHSGLITTDAGVTMLMFAAVYFFWRGCHRRRAIDPIAFSIAFALAHIAKFSAVVLIPIVLALAVVAVVREHDRRRVAVHIGVMIVGAFAATIVAIWAIYGFRWSAVRDPQSAAAQEESLRPNLIQRELDGNPSGGHFDVRSAAEEWVAKKALAARSPFGFSPHDLARVRGSIPLGPIQSAVVWANDAHLLPEAYLEGFAFAGASTAGRLSFLNGRSSITGFHTFYFWTFLYKTPIPAIIIIVLGIYAAVQSQRKELLFLGVPAVIYLLIALSSNLNIGHRHILPMFPFIYVLCGAVVSPWLRFSNARRWTAGAVAVTALAVSANVVFAGRPSLMAGHHLAYMNEIAGGPDRGYVKLNDSNFDWGQDLERLARWVRAQKSVEPLNLIYFGTASPRYYGLRYHDLRTIPFPPPQPPGYVAISTFDYVGIFFEGGWRDYWRNYFAQRNARLVGKAGYSILIFKVE